MNVGVIGTGRMGSKRIEHCLAHGKTHLAWVVSRDLDHGREIVAAAGGDENGRDTVPVYRTEDEAFAAESAKAVIVTTPNAMHAETCCKALDAGLHVFTEYPHATNTPAGEEMLKRAETAGLLLYVGLTHRHSHHHRLLQHYCGEDGPLGQPRAMTSILCTGNPISRWYDDDEYSGGMFVSSMYHFIDESLSLYGEAAGVTATYDAVRDRTGIVERDTGRCTLSFVSGVTAHIHYSRGFPKPGLGSRSVILFDEGYIELVNGEFRVISSKGSKIEKAPEEDTLRKETVQFLDAIHDGSTDRQTAVWAQASLETAIRAADSAGVGGQL